MQTSEFYYGLPQDQWDTLLTKAEDLLRDENLGSHLVGLYPAGNRIYGIESEPPGILCLYVDSVESLLDPSTFKYPGYHVFYHGSDHAPILMVDLFHWARTIIHQLSSCPAEYFIDIIPTSHDVIYEDESIIEILQAIRELIIARKSSILQLPIPIKDMFETAQRDIRLLYRRARLILLSTNSFYPCVNPAWGKVYNINSLPIPVPKDLCDIDNSFRNYILGRSVRPSSDDVLSLNKWYMSQIRNFQESVIDDTSALSLKAGQTVASLYRCLL